MKKRIIVISIIVLVITLLISILLRVNHVNNTKGMCLHPSGGCYEDENGIDLCVDSTKKCDFIESINYYFFE